MTRSVLLVSSISRRLWQAGVGAPSIGEATQLKRDEIAERDADDRLAIERAIRA